MFETVWEDLKFGFWIADFGLFWEGTQSKI